MKDRSWEISLAIGLIVASIVLYGIHYVIFHDLHHIGIYTMGDIAFVPIEVLLVTLIIHRLLENREKSQKLEKLNMVIGTFFSSVGTELLTWLSDHDPRLDEIRSDLIPEKGWTPREFARVRGRLEKYSFTVDVESMDLVRLRQSLGEKEDFMIRLLENPVLLEHESFTELLRAVFHVTEELLKRDDLTACSETDLEHLRGDIDRVYGLLVRQWLDYMEYLQKEYPYLYSLAMRTNPFDESASVAVD
ncbi:MAG: hypothetical protein ACP5C4_05350 [Methanomicrobiales archaeon]